jgi:hypothetical protein
MSKLGESIDYSLKGLSDHLNSLRDIGDELWAFVADTLEVDVLIVEMTHDGIYFILNVEPSPGARRNVVVIGGNGSHYETIGVSKSDGIQTLFKFDDPFVVAIRQKGIKHVPKSVASLAPVPSVNVASLAPIPSVNVASLAPIPSITVPSVAPSIPTTTLPPTMALQPSAFDFSSLLQPPPTTSQTPQKVQKGTFQTSNLALPSIDLAGLFSSKTAPGVATLL